MAAAFVAASLTCMNPASQRLSPLLPLRAWLALALALLPAIAAHAAYALSIRDGLAPACLPYWEGCTSISRAARHGDGNLLFKWMVLPCAPGFAALWWEARRWLAQRGGDPGVTLPALGLLASLSLAAYVLFLGVEGDVSRWLRRYGALIYFATTILAQLWFVRGQWSRGARDSATRTLFALSVLMLVFGLASTAVSAMMEERELKDRIENAIEWTLGGLFTLWFAALAWLWRAESQLPPAKKRAPPPPRSG